LIVNEENHAHFSNLVSFQRALLEQNSNQILNAAMFIYHGFIPCLIPPVSAEKMDIQQAEIGPEGLASWLAFSSTGRGYTGPNWI